MNLLFKIEAIIRLHKQGGRTWPIKAGYRPGFNFVNDKQTSGSILLLTKEHLSSGEEGLAEVSFVSNELLGDVKPGTECKLYEGPTEIGTCLVINVRGWETSV